MFKIINKKIIISLIVILILGAGGFFCWQNREIKGSPDDYVIKETEEGKIVENKRAGLTVKVPEGWEVKKIKVEEGAGIFYSPDAELEWQEEKIVLPLEKGCLIRATLVYKKIDFELLEQEVKYDLFMIGATSKIFEKVIINNYQALKTTFNTYDLGSGVSIYIPKENKIYGFHLNWASDGEKRCIQEFDKFLETILIQPH